MNFENYVIGTLSQDAFVMVNKKLAKQLGFVEAGLLAELIFTHKQAKQENAFFEQGEKGPWFYLTQAKVEERLGMKRREHETAIKNLAKDLVIKKKRMGLPAKNYYQINWEKIVEKLEENDPEPAPLPHCTKRTIKEGRNVQTGLDETYNQDRTKHPFIHINKKNLEKQDIKTSNKNLVNKELNNLSKNSLSKLDLTDIANEFYSEFAVGRWGKKQWFNLIDQYTTEIIESGVVLSNPEAYIYSSLQTMATNHDFNNGKVESESNGKFSLYDFISKEEFM